MAISIGVDLQVTVPLGKLKEIEAALQEALYPKTRLSSDPCKMMEGAVDHVINNVDFARGLVRELIPENER